MPSRSPRTVRIRPAQVRRHRVRERAVRPRMDADLGRQLGIGDERGHRLLGQRQALVDVGHRREHVRGGRGSGSAGDRARKDRDTLASLRGDDGLRCRRAPHRRRAEPRQPEAGTRRDRPVRRAVRRSRRTRAAPPRSSGSPATSAATPTSGPRSCATSAPTSPPPTGRGCASASSSWPPGCSGPPPSPTWSRRSRATRRTRTTRRAPRPRSPRSPPTSASTR